jgi:hypothetical protein
MMERVIQASSGVEGRDSIASLRPRRSKTVVTAFLGIFGSSLRYIVSGRIDLKAKDGFP